MQDKVTQKRPETGRFLHFSVISLSPCCGGEHDKQGEYLKAAEEHVKAQGELA